MKLSFEEATAYSRKGYINDHDEIGRIFIKLLETPVIQLGGIPYDNAVAIIDALLTCWEITPDEKTRSELTVGEFLILTKEFKDNPVSYSPEEEELNRKCYYQFLIHAENLLRLSQHNTAVLFRYVGVNDFLRYVAEKVICNKTDIMKFPKIFKRDVKKTMDFKINENTSIQEYLDELNNFQHRHWTPCQSISDFEKGIMESYYEADYLLLKYTQYFCHDCLCADTIKLKYSGMIYSVDDIECVNIERIDEEWLAS